jgi:hypothetical protein
VFAAAVLLTAFAHAVPPTCQTTQLGGPRTLEYSDDVSAIYSVNSPPPFGGPLPDAIYFEFYKYPAGPLETGTFDLASQVNGNYGTCEQCIRILQDTTDPQTPPKTFFQTGGTLTIGAATVPGSATISLDWANVTLAEVTINPENFESTLVPDGECYVVGLTVGVSGCKPLRVGNARTLEAADDDGTYNFASYTAVPAPSLGTALPDSFDYEFYAPTGSPLPTGLFNLTSQVNSNYVSCEQCLIVRQDKDAGTPTKYFFQNGGTININPMTPPGSAQISLTHQDVTLGEVTLDVNTFETTPVPDGECLQVVTDTIFYGGFDAP